MSHVDSAFSSVKGSCHNRNNNGVKQCDSRKNDGIDKGVDDMADDSEDEDDDPSGMPKVNIK